MKFILESMKIRNFKGLREQDIEFNSISTTICGENATGKTTVVDAFTWLLFEKDSKGRSQFEIKTLENGEPLHGLDHSVEGIFKIDGRQMKLKKIYKEVWTKRRGDNHETFTGHEIERFINDIPVKKTEYEKKIGQLVDEKIFQLLTDPMYFSQQLGWKERRGTLFSLAGGDITKEDVFKVNPELNLIGEDLEDKTIEELKKSLAYQRRELNKERDNIPVKIETLNSTIKEVNLDTLDIRIRGLKGSINRIEENMIDATKLNEEQLKKQDELYQLKSKLKKIEYDIRSNIKDPDEELKLEIKDLKKELSNYESDFFAEQINKSRYEKAIASDKEYIEILRNEYTQVAEKEIEIDENIKACPTCQRPFSEDEVKGRIAKLEESFKANQVKQLKDIREKGQFNKAEIEKHEKELEIVETRYKEIKEQLEKTKATIDEKELLLGEVPKSDLSKLLKENEKYQNVLKEIDKIQDEIKNRPRNGDLTELKRKKLELEDKLKENEKDLHQDEINKQTREKIESLMTEEKILSQQISKIEQKEHIADEFITTKAELIEKSINGKFEKVSFRLFKKQINGALDETCEVLVDGVPFDNANTAGQVNAGLDVINSLCKHYDIYTPIFIDNRESVNQLIETKSQLINLRVTKHKNLRVETE